MDLKNKKPKCAAVIVAAGSGTRMGGPVPKQFIEVAGKPLMAHTLETFEASGVTDDIVIVTGEEYLDHVRRTIVQAYGFTKVRDVVPGGRTRCFSVRSGLEACPADTDFVFIHDAVRAMITGEIIERGLDAVMRHGSAVASIGSKDTVRITNEAGEVVSTPPRERVRSIQTPQIFDFGKLLRAYRLMKDEEMERFTDDGMVWEQYSGLPLMLYDGAPGNIKVTTPDDLIFAEKILGNKELS